MPRRRSTGPCALHSLAPGTPLVGKPSALSSSTLGGNDRYNRRRDRHRRRSLPQLAGNDGVICQRKDHRSGGQPDVGKVRHPRVEVGGIAAKQVQHRRCGNHYGRNGRQHEEAPHVPGVRQPARPLPLAGRPGCQAPGTPLGADATRSARVHGQSPPSWSFPAGGTFELTPALRDMQAPAAYRASANTPGSAVLRVASPCGLGGPPLCDCSTM